MWTQADIDQLKRAIASGALEVRYADGRAVTYRSLDEMRQTLALMVAEVRGAAEPRVSYAAFRRGL